MRLGRRILAARAAATTVAAVCTLGLLPGVAQAAPADAWASERGGGGNAAYNAGETVLTPATAARVAASWSVSYWPRSGIDAVTVVGGNVYRVVETQNYERPSRLEVRSALTGAVLWTLDLPQQAWSRSLTVVSSRALIPFSSDPGDPGGFMAVDLTTRTLAYTRFLPPKLLSWSSGSITGPLVADATRVYISGADRAVIAYRISDGARLWMLPVPLDRQGAPKKQYGLAVGNGMVYRSGDDGVTAHAATTGGVLWTASGYGPPVLAGGRVFTANFGGITAYAAGGCGQSRCSAVWDTRLGDYSRMPEIGGASGTTLFAGHYDQTTGAGRLARLSAASGAVTWTTTTGRWAGRPARAGDTVWVRNSYVTPDDKVRCGVMGFSAVGRSASPLAFLRDLPCNQGGLAVASGSVLLQNWSGEGLRAFRVPGT